MFWLFFIALILVILIIVYTSIPYMENKVLFYPSKKHFYSPDISYKDVYINVRNHKVKYHEPCKNYKYIHGWHFNNFPGNKTILFCHGNTGNITHRRYIIDMCHKLKLNLFMFDYRGYGQSSGNPSKSNLKQDGKNAYLYLKNKCKVRPKKIIVWGESLGGVAAVNIAAKFKCKALLLLSTFSSLDDIANFYFDDHAYKPLISGATMLSNLRYNHLPNKQTIKKVKCPVVIMHSKNDNLIPYKCAKQLYNNIHHDKKKLITIDGHHSGPIINNNDLNDLFSYCDIDKISKKISKPMLKRIKTYAEENNHFIDR